MARDDGKEKLGIPADAQEDGGRLVKDGVFYDVVDDQPTSWPASLRNARRCEKIKGDGSRCKSPAMREDQFCAAHTTGDSPFKKNMFKEGEERAAEMAEASRQKAIDNRRRKKMSPREYLAMKAIEQQDLIAQSFIKAMAEGNNAEAVRAAAEFLNQSFGRPQERVEMSMPSTVEELQSLPADERERLKAQLREKASHLRLVQSEVESG